MIELVIGIWSASTHHFIHPPYSHSAPLMFSGMPIPYAEMYALNKILNDCRHLLGSSGDPIGDSGTVVAESSSAPPESTSGIEWNRD